MATVMDIESPKILELTTEVFAPTLDLEVVPVLLATASPLAEEGKAWSVRQARGRIQGIGVRVSGLGAYARARGSMSFSTRRLETSRTYKEMKKSYGFSAGVRGFWSWIGLGANASSHKQELRSVFNELQQEQKTSGRINIDLYVTGLYPNVPVSAEAYILAFAVKEKNSSQTPFPIISGDAPTQDTGAQGQNGQDLPIRDNQSTIDI